MKCIVISDFSSFQPILRHGATHWCKKKDHVWELRNSSSAKGIWNRLCPVDKNGKREFEPTMYARLEKLGLGHKKHNPDLLTEDTFEEDREPVFRLWTCFNMLEWCLASIIFLIFLSVVMLQIFFPGGNWKILHLGHRPRHHHLETSHWLQFLGFRTEASTDLVTKASR